FFRYKIIAESLIFHTAAGFVRPRALRPGGEWHGRLRPQYLAFFSILTTATETPPKPSHSNSSIDESAHRQRPECRLVPTGRIIQIDSQFSHKGFYQDVIR